MTEKRCSECGSLVGLGLHKVCNKSTRQENIEKMIVESGENMRERIVSAQLRDIAQASGSDSRAGNWIKQHSSHCHIRRGEGGSETIWAKNHLLQ